MGRANIERTTMTYIDPSTRHDLEELQVYYDNAESRMEEERIALRMAEVIEERADGRMRPLRDMLIKATRQNDRRAIRYAQQEIKKIELDRKNGNASV